jgi:predicted dehydrogenase
VVVLAELSGGVMVNHIVNWLSPLKERSTIVTGERGCYIVDTLTADLTFYANGAVSTDWEAIRNFRGVSEGDVTRFAIARREPLVVEHEHFRDAVASGDETGIVTSAQGLRTVEISTAVLESAATGQTVRTR